MIVFAGSDHAGFELRSLLVAHLRAAGHTVHERGATGSDPYDYPDAADVVCQELLNPPEAFGLLICGSGIGISIRANRYRHIRAALCMTTEMARLARAHNHANVLCLGARLIEPELAKEILMIFLASPEDHAERHEIRVAKLDGNISCGNER